MINPIAALSPLDGRYAKSVEALRPIFSEYGLMRARVKVELSWLKALAAEPKITEIPVFSDFTLAEIDKVIENFSLEDAAAVKAIEATTNHDVKAIEYWLKERFAGVPEVAAASEFIHFACTSEDINNLSHALMLQEARETVILPKLAEIIEKLTGMAHDLAAVPMMSRTHGQPATPTTLGKELAVLARRLTRQVRRVESAEYLGKFNGATGTYGAHVVAVPEADWQSVSRTFVEGLGLVWNPLTTQIESHDWQAELYCDIARFNRVAHNLATDVWSYISLGYFRQRLAAQGSTGSSTMPHKVNPIRFENGEANLEISCSLLETLAATLVTSRLQRDLTDSTTQRNIGTALGHSLLAIDNIRRGLAGLDVDAARLEADLDATWEVLGEPVQQAMRAASVAGATGMADPYERLKKLTRGKRVTPEAMRAFISGLGMPDDVEARLLALTPATYTGLAARLVEHLDD